jgi:hypothetical protein
LLLGELNLPIEVLLTIEEGSSSPDELQKNMGVIDECGNPSSITHVICTASIYSEPARELASTDECVKAADIYGCFQSKAPVMVNSIQNGLISSESSAPTGVTHSRSICLFLYLLFQI